MPDKPWFAYYEKMGMPKALAYPERTLVDYLQQMAAERPNEVFATCKRSSLTYRELDEASNAVAGAFAEFGIVKGDRVILQLPTSLQFLIAEFGAWKAGAIVSPIDPLYAVREIHERICDYDAKAAVVFAPLYKKMKDAQAGTHLERIITADVPGFLSPLQSALVAAACAALRLVKGKKDLGLQKILKAHAGAAVQGARLAPKDPAVILTSSGTSGSPKGVEGRHECYVMAGMQLHAWIQPLLSAGGRMMLPLPMDHVFANVGVQSLALISGSQLVLVPNPRDLADLLAALHQKRPDFFCGVPRLFEALCARREIGQEHAAVSRMKACFCGGDALRPELKERFERITGVPIFQGYSLTEGMMGCALNPLAGPNKPGSIGMPLPDVDMHIAPDGEMLLSAPQLASGYWRKATETSAMFTVCDGKQWLRTGDIGCMDEDGYFFITGRKKEMIKVSGRQVSPTEVEEVIAEHPAVADVAVAGIPHDEKGEVVKAWIVLKREHARRADPEDVDEFRKEILLFCREFLAPYMVPSFIEFCADIPKTRLGKTRRWKLKEQETGEEF